MGSGGSKSQTKHHSSQSYGHDTSQAITRSGYSDVAHNHNVGDVHQFLDDNVTPQIKKTTIQSKYGQYHLFLEHTDGDGNMRACSDIISKYRLAHAKERCEEEKIKYPDDMIYVAEGCWDDTNIRGTPPGIVEHQYKDDMVMALYRTYWYECFSDSLQNESGDWFKDDAQTEKATELQIGSWTYVHADPRVKARSDEYGDYNVYDDIYSGYGQ
eukprot:758408_1